MRKLLLLWLVPAWTFAQINVQDINPFIEYSNESVHGMLIIHRMLENFNQELNKYVDLESTQVNFYGNDDLPKNIFEDQDHLFYDVTPHEWYEMCQEKTQSITELSSLQGTIQKMHGITERLNQLRFDLQSLINTLNLDESSNQKIVYKKLAQGEILYEDFYLTRNELMTEIKGLNVSRKDLLSKSLISLHQNIEDGFKALRIKNTEHLKQVIPELTVSINQIPQGNGPEINEIRMGATQVLNDFKTFVQAPKVDSVYDQYGSFYFYHNVKTINKTNRYGNGIFFFMNEIMKKKGQDLLFFEIPHYFKVIYPSKEEVTPFVASTHQKIDQTPVKLQERLVISNEQTILVDNHQVEFMIFDHKEQDGDVLSLNFNGDWILENHALSTKPLPLKLSLNAEGKNYLVLHAVNTGSRPPNTMAISYFYKGKRKQIILNADLENSELIEIKVDAADN